MKINNDIESVKCAVFFALESEIGNNGVMNKQPIDCRYDCPYFKRINESHPFIGRCTFTQNRLEELVDRLVDGLYEDPDEDPPRERTEEEKIQWRDDRLKEMIRNKKIDAAAPVLSHLRMPDGEQCGPARNRYVDAVVKFQNEVLGNKYFSADDVPMWENDIFDPGYRYSQKPKEETK